MKTMFIPAIKKDNNFNKRLLENMHKGDFSIFYTIQYKDMAKEISKYLGYKGKIKQVLGCSVIKDNKKILLITDGRFHALNIAINSNKEIYIFDGLKIERISKEDIEKYNKVKKSKILKFLSSNEIGIIVSTKTYQNRLKEALILKEKIEKMDKKAFLFICDNAKIEELENFSLPIYINTACPGLDKDNNKILNYIDILSYIK